jgi:hypothetical protein
MLAATQAGQPPEHTRPEALLEPGDASLELGDLALEPGKVDLAYRGTLRVVDEVRDAEGDASPIGERAESVAESRVLDERARACELLEALGQAPVPQGCEGLRLDPGSRRSAGGEPPFRLIRVAEREAEDLERVPRTERHSPLPDGLSVAADRERRIGPIERSQRPRDRLWLPRRIERAPPRHPLPERSLARARDEQPDESLDEPVPRRDRRERVLQALAARPPELVRVSVEDPVRPVVACCEAHEPCPELSLREPGIDLDQLHAAVLDVAVEACRGVATSRDEHDVDPAFEVERDLGIGGVGVVADDESLDQSHRRRTLHGLGWPGRMKLVMTLLARDEADVIGEQIAFHLAAGVDFVVATDHRSADGTTEILESFARDGRLHLIREDSEEVRQAEWVTRMARLAAAEHGADWVLNADADEFWWPRGGSFKSALGAVPDGFATVGALVRVFVPRPDDGGPFWERMTVRLATPAPINDPATSYRPVRHIVHRGGRDVEISQGVHTVRGLPGKALTDLYPIEVLHFPFRSRAQVEVKRRKAPWHRGGNVRGDLVRARRTVVEGRRPGFYEEVVIDDDALRRGLADGSLVEDVRVRDRLRELEEGTAAAFPPATLEEEIGNAVDAAVLTEAQLVRLRRRLDELEARLTSLERRRA